MGSDQSLYRCLLNRILHHLPTWVLPYEVCCIPGIQYQRTCTTSEVFRTDPSLSFIKLCVSENLCRIPWFLSNTCKNAYYRDSSFVQLCYTEALHFQNTQDLCNQKLKLIDSTFTDRSPAAFDLIKRCSLNG